MFVWWVFSESGSNSVNVTEKELISLIGWGREESEPTALPAHTRLASTMELSLFSSVTTSNWERLHEGPWTPLHLTDVSFSFLRVGNLQSFTKCLCSGSQGSFNPEVWTSYWGGADCSGIVRFILPVRDYNISRLLFPCRDTGLPLVVYELILVSNWELYIVDTYSSYKRQKNRTMLYHVSLPDRPVIETFNGSCVTVFRGKVAKSEIWPSNIVKYRTHIKCKVMICSIKERQGIWK